MRAKNTIISNTPKHIQVADIVRQQILSGDFTPGTRLCSDEELAAKYQVHRHTVAEGLKLLVAEGLLERAPRRGSIVTGRHKEPVYLLIACPGFLEANNNSAVFVRRLYKNLHLQLMSSGISVITVPMSPTNNPSDISEKYFDVIPNGAKVVCVGEWGLPGQGCLDKKKCNVVFYDFQNGKRSKLVKDEWKKVIFDRAHGAAQAVRALAEVGLTRPLLVLADNQQPAVNAAVVEALTEYFPGVSRENLLWCKMPEYENFADEWDKKIQGLSFDSLFFSNVELARIILEQGDSGVKDIVSNDITEIISRPDLCHCAIDPEELAKMTIELFIQPDGTEKNIRPELYNRDVLNRN